MVTGHGKYFKQGYVSIEDLKYWLQSKVSYIRVMEYKREALYIREKNSEGKYAFKFSGLVMTDKGAQKAVKIADAENMIDWSWRARMDRNSYARDQYNKLASSLGLDLLEA
jgi:hypothetical protein